MASAVIEDIDELVRLTTDSERLKALLEVSQSLHGSLDTDDLLKRVIDRTRDLVHAQTVSILLHDPSMDELFFRVEVGNNALDAEKLREVRFPASHGIAGRVLAMGKPELILDVSRDPRHFKQVDQLTGFVTRSMIAAPILARQRIIGVIEGCHQQPDAFTQTDLNFLTTIAGTIGMALDNARMYQELQSAYLNLQHEDREKDLLIEHSEHENFRLRREIEARYRFSRIKGNSPQLLKVFQLCQKAIESEITVLILGETGTGKELVARSIHQHSVRRHQPFVSQNCGGIPESLLTSELFGYRRGAFTGALADKKGLFEEADGGTIFLDEVGDMTPSMQVALLRVLQDGEIRPVGAGQPRNVNVRVISATNRDLATDVRSGRFREDLYYRLNVFPIKLPPLRERSGDIPILVRHFVRKHSERNRKEVRGISKMAMGCLSGHAFPGNVRELENEIERAVALVEDHGVIELEHLSRSLRSGAVCTNGPEPPGTTLKEKVEHLEISALREALAKHSGNKTLAARELGLSRFGLIKKIQRYQL
ncbi:MAG: sigma 54-interacting transcriptional regulator [Syntrophobacteraceae bacterium]|jgi:Nif-specific regulatory protein|nr:sigma 54-interacting transcriptional regulator [Syntrophobacteraceae bacterium]